jgi:hypothetical protein
MNSNFIISDNEFKNKINNNTCTGSTNNNNNNKINNSTPWVEKYRPSNFDDIVLDDINKKIEQLRKTIEECNDTLNKIIGN